MIRWSTVRAWAGVHGTRPAAGALAAVGGAALLWGEVAIARLGMVEFLKPVSMLLLLPTAAGVAAAVAAHNTVRLPLPDPPRAVVARTLWAPAWTLLAVGVVCLGGLVGATVACDAVARNVLLHAALGLAVVATGRAHLVWLPSFGYTLACMLFGFPQHDRRYYWWAVIMEETTSAGQLVVVAGVYAVALVGYVTAPRGTRRRPRRVFGAGR